MDEGRCTRTPHQQDRAPAHTAKATQEFLVNELGEEDLGQRTSGCHRHLTATRLTTPSGEKLKGRLVLNNT